MGRKKSKKPQSGLDDLFAEMLSNDEEQADDREADRDEDTPSSGSGVKTVRISLVEPNPDQPRKSFDDESLSELADSIRVHGVLQPLIVREVNDDTYLIVAGERRWRAARLAGLTEVPVLIRDLDDKQADQLALIENLQREDLNPIDEAAGYQNLMDSYGMTQQEVAEAVGKPRSSVANSLRLLSLCDEARERLANGEISPGHGKLLAGVDEALQKQLLEQVIGEGLSVKQLSTLIDASKKQRSKPAAKKLIKKPTFLVEAELALKETFGQPVKVEQAKGGKTKLTIECKSEEEFRELMKRLTDKQS